MRIAYFSESMNRVLPTLCLLTTFISCWCQSLRHEHEASIQIQYNPGRPANTFIPSQALGAAFDGHGEGDIDRMLSRSSISAMKSVGLKPLSYRLRTELGDEAWHWNPHGSWSDPAHHQGYWTSCTGTRSLINTSYGYFLPRRGNSHDNANDDGYSRIDDGDTSTFWKSNPYLAAHFTGEADALHPQWVIIDFGKQVAVNALQVRWGDPFAISCTVDYAADQPGYFDPYQPGIWQAVSNDRMNNRLQKDQLIVFSSQPVMARFLRLTMWESSGTVQKPHQDVRDLLGFAIREIYAGLMDNKGSFHDYVNHTRSNKTQTVIRVSSTDPWHRARDIDKATEQAGIDRFFRCGITQSTPVMMPAGLLFDTPENMCALVEYLQKRHYAVNEMELGEEPEGQLIHPADYAALYCRWATNLKKKAPYMHFGGPSFAWISSAENDDNTFTEQAWMRICLDYLRTHGHLDDFNFFSTEWYPAEDICAPTPPQLLMQPERMRTALYRFQHEILPKSTPIYITEYGYSAFSGVAEVRIEGALMYADIIGQFLTLGGSRAYLYGYEPAYLEQRFNCEWGNNMLFALNEDNGRIMYRLAAYYGVRMLTHRWAVPANATLSVFPVQCLQNDTLATSLISAYALQRPDGHWALAMINKDPDKQCTARLSVSNLVTQQTAAIASFELTQYSGKQYHWKSDGPKGHPTLSIPPETIVINGCDTVQLPPYSLTIISER